MYLNEVTDASANSLSEEDTGQDQVPVVSLDDDIRETISFVKMDIEGAEYDALIGCRRHIQTERPKLVISVYHGFEDLWRLPLLIDQMRPDYQFYLRYHGGDLFPTETLLYAI